MLEFLEKEQIDKGIIQGIWEDKGLQPTIENCGDYFEAERIALTGRYGEEAEIEKAQTFAHYCWQAARPPARTCWRRTWPWSSDVRPGMCRSM